MATLTGEALMDAVVESTGAILSGLFHEALATRLQAAIDAGITSNLALASILGSNAQILAAVPEGEDPIGFLVNEVADAKQADDPQDPGDGFIEAGIDGGGFNSPLSFDAGDGAYKFVDDAAVFNNVMIDNFSSDDVIAFQNASIDDYFFASEGTDVTISFNNDGTLNIIKLTGIISSDTLVYDQASFEAATGFDAFFS